MKKSQQDDIKDVGGFVLGRLKGGRRKKDCVISRSALTLDMDYAVADIGDQSVSYTHLTSPLDLTKKLTIRCKWNIEIISKFIHFL